MTLERNTGTGEPLGPLGLRVGQRAQRTQTILARDVELYAQITGDRNPLHFDAVFAARTRFGRLVAQGGIAAGMLNALVATRNPEEPYREYASPAAFGRRLAAGPF
jgi:acyl dehydratase